MKSIFEKKKVRDIALTFLRWLQSSCREQSSFDGVDNSSKSPSQVTTVLLKILCKFNVVKSERLNNFPRTFYRSTPCMVLILETRLSLIWRMWIRTGHSMSQRFPTRLDLRVLNTTWWDVGYGIITHSADVATRQRLTVIIIHVTMQRWISRSQWIWVLIIFIEC